MKKLLVGVLSIVMLAGCNQTENAENVNAVDEQNQLECGDFIELHQNGVAVYVNKQHIILVEQNGSKSAISFDGGLERVNGMNRGSNQGFDETQEQVIKLISCEK